MSYSIKTKDGIVIDGIPDDIPENDQRLKDKVAHLRNAGQKYATLQAGKAQEEVPKPRNEVIEGAAKGLSQGASSLVRGAAGGVAGTVGVVTDPIVALLNTVLPKEYQGLPAAQGMKLLLDKLGVPESETAAQRIVEAGTAGLTGAALTAGAGQAASAGAGLAPTVAQKAAQVVGAQPVQQVAGGIGAGIASQGAAEAGADPLVQLGAGMAGSLLGSSVSPSPVRNDLVTAGEKAKVRIKTSDVFPPQAGALKKIQSFGEDIPFFGTGGMRKGQKGERVEAVRDVVRQYGAEDLASASDDVMADLLGKRSADLNKWSQAKNEVIEKLSKAGPVLGEKGGNVPTLVPMPKTVEKIDQSIASLKSLKTDQVAPVIGVLEDWKQAIQGQDLKNVETLRKQIGEVFKAPELAAVRSTGEKVLSNVYGSVKDDMTSYIAKAGGQADLNKWQVANKQLSNMMNEMKLPALKSAIKKGEATPEMINTILFSSKESDARALYRNLSENGRDHVKSAIIAKAASAKKGEIVPDAFAKEYKKLGAQVGVFFNDQDKEKVDGLVKVLENTNRAVEAAANPATGARVVIPASYAALATLVPGSTMERFIGATAGMALAGGLANLYESKPVRDLLIKISQSKAGSEQEAALIRRVLEASRAQKSATQKESK